MNIAYLIGVGHSGTSCLAGSLETAGAYLPDPTKLKENAKVYKLNDDVIGKSWHTVQTTATKWSDEHRKRRDLLLKDFEKGSEGKLIVVKDPRFLMTLDFWLEATPNAKLAATFRHVESRRGSEGKWANYCNELIRRYKVKPFPIVCFDDPVDVYEESLEMVCKDFGLGKPSYFDPSRRHQTFKGKNTNEIFGTLKKFSEEYREQRNGK